MREIFKTQKASNSPQTSVCRVHAAPPLLKIPFVAKSSGLLTYVAPSIMILVWAQAALPTASEYQHHLGRMREEWIHRSRACLLIVWLQGVITRDSATS